MQVRAQLTPEELKDAARLIRPKMFWLRMALANWYALTILIAVVGAIIYHAMNSLPYNWAGALGVAGIALLFLGFSWWRYNSRIGKITDRWNKNCGNSSLDTDGIRTDAANGATTFVPWSAYSTWKEGKLVFLVKGDNAEQVIPKEGLGSSEQVKGLLASKVS
jgi:hypothetical protein